MSINRVNLSGNLTRDPELRMTQGGSQVLTFGIAVNDRHRNQQTGEWEDRPNFIDCVVFGRRAEPLGKFLHKGGKVAIEGKLRQSTWEKDGQRRNKVEVIVEECEFLSASKAENGTHGGTADNYSGSGQSARNSASYAAQGGTNAYGQQASTPDLYEDDIPF